MKRIFVSLASLVVRPERRSAGRRNRSPFLGSIESLGARISPAQIAPGLADVAPPPAQVASPADSDSDQDADTSAADGDPTPAPPPADPTTPPATPPGSGTVETKDQVDSEVGG